MVLVDLLLLLLLLGRRNVVGILFFGFSGPAPTRVSATLAGILFVIKLLRLTDLYLLLHFFLLFLFHLPLAGLRVQLSLAIGRGGGSLLTVFELLQHDVEVVHSVGSWVDFGLLLPNYLFVDKCLVPLATI